MAALVKSNTGNSFERLYELKMPVLIANGDKDTLIDTANSWDSYQHISDAYLAIFSGGRPWLPESVEY